MTLSTQDRRAFEANIWKTYLLHFLMYFQLWWSIWVLYLTDLRGFSLTQVAVLEALFWGTAVLAEVPTGVIADRFGRKISLALGAGFTAVAVLVFGLATSYTAVLISYLVWALGVAFLSGAEYALLFESLRALGREGEFQRVAGRFGAIFSFAALAGGLAGAPIAAATDLSVPILLSAGIVAPGVLVALSLREPPLPEGEVRLAYADLLRESARTATRLPAVRYMLILSALVAALAFGPALFMQPFLSSHDVEVGLFGFIQTPVRVAGMVGALAAYLVVARLGTRGTFLAAPLLMGGAFLALGAWDSIYAFAAFPVVGFVNTLLLPPATDYLNQRIPNNQRATILSLRTMLVSLVAAALAPGLGVAADMISLRAVFLISAGVVAVVLPVALGLWLRADQQEREGAAERETQVP
ncbi:MAG: MFS transporter [Chloroflexi bacterium]|nr:MFS transporter [Chloroflexota bacterium]